MPFLRPVTGARSANRYRSIETHGSLAGRAFRRPPQILAARPLPRRDRPVGSAVVLGTGPWIYSIFDCAPDIRGVQRIRGSVQPIVPDVCRPYGATSAAGVAGVNTAPIEELGDFAHYRRNAVGPYLRLPLWRRWPRNRAPRQNAVRSEFSPVITYCGFLYVGLESARWISGGRPIIGATPTDVQIPGIRMESMRLFDGRPFVA